MSFERLNDLFHRARALQPEARRAFLEEACADDPELLERVRALLRADAELPDSFLTENTRR